MKALVIGGTGPTGPFLVAGLRERGYRVAVLHRGTHEIPEIPADVEHIHADPHFRETLDAALAGRTFDLVLATYGRLRFIAEAVVGRAPRLLAVGGFAGYRGYLDPAALHPHGMVVPTPEDAPLVTSENEARFPALITQAERVVMEHHATGHYAATLFRYPYVYGPYQVAPREWCVIRRLLDRRPYIIVPDGGLTLITRGYAGNLAHAVLLAADRPGVAAGQIYNTGDDRQLTVQQWVEIIADAMGHRWEVVSLPDVIAHAGRALLGADTSHHRLLDTAKAQRELGYRDLTAPDRALASTVRWYLDHPLERGGDTERRLGDPFDYTAEDDAVAAYGDALRAFAPLPRVRVSDRPHSYAHPREPGLARDHRAR